MELQNHFNEKKKLQGVLLDYICENDSKNELLDLNKILDIQKIRQNRQSIKELLYLIKSIIDNHHHHSHFFSKIEQILHILKDDINNNFTSSELFNIYKNHKNVLFFLVTEKIISMDIKQIFEFKESFQLPDDFCTKIKIGENDNKICQIIREDLLDEFILYINKNKIELNSNVNYSIYETNSFLINQNKTLIEYATFYGSIQIFQYLQKNGVNLTPSLWVCAVHSNNLEMIHLLEENHVKNVSFLVYLEESIKCFHNELAKYFLEKYLSNEKNINKKLFQISIKFSNFFFIQKEEINQSTLFDLIQNEYCYSLVYLLLKNDKSININAKEIFIVIVCKILHYFFCFKYSFKFNIFNQISNFKVFNRILNYFVFNSILKSLTVNNVYKFYYLIQFKYLLFELYSWFIV